MTIPTVPVTRRAPLPPPLDPEAARAELDRLFWSSRMDRGAFAITVLVGRTRSVLGRWLAGGTIPRGVRVWLATQAANNATNKAAWNRALRIPPTTPAPTEDTDT